MGPLNERLKKSNKSESSVKVQLFTEDLANWYVAHFGDNFEDMERFVEYVMEAKGDKDEFLSQSMRKYMLEFDTV